MKKAIIWIVIIVLVIFALVRFVQTSNDGEVAGELSGGNLIEVSEQSPDRLYTSINAVELTSGGFVVVKAVANGNAGVTVGSSRYLEAGRHENVQVLMELVPEQEYAAFIYLDDGNRLFNEEIDTPIANEEGAPLAAFFSVAADDGFIGK